MYCIALFHKLFFLLKLCADPNVNIVGCRNRESSQCDLYIMTLLVGGRRWCRKAALFYLPVQIVGYTYVLQTSYPQKIPLKNSMVPKIMTVTAWQSTVQCAPPDLVILLFHDPLQLQHWLRQCVSWIHEVWTLGIIFYPNFTITWPKMIEFCDLSNWDPVWINFKNIMSVNEIYGILRTSIYSCA